MSTKIGSVIELPNPSSADSTGVSVSSTIGDGDPGATGPNLGEFEPIKGFEPIDAASLGIESIYSGNDNPGGLGSGRRGWPRGRKRGPRNATEPAAEETPLHQNLAAALADLTGAIQTSHAMLAALLSIKELALDKSEAASLADAIKNVLKHYNVPVDPKKLAIANLCFVGANIYGTRALAFALARPPKSAAPKPVNIDSKKTADTSKVNGFPAPADFHILSTEPPEREEIP